MSKAKKAKPVSKSKPKSKTKSKTVDVRFPPTLYIGVDGSGKGRHHYFVGDLKDCDVDGETVGIYRLVETRMVRVTRSLE